MRTGYTRIRRAGLGARALALYLALTTVLITGRAQGEPGDIFTLGAPVIGSPPPQATSIGDGDASVSTQTGALQYSYPIAVPPGRNGMQPHIALSYSSQAPIYGGIAAGWTLSGVPSITEDTSKGTLWKQQNGARYTSSLAGGRPLVQTSDSVPGGSVALRAQNDATFTRYQQVNVHPDGDDAVWKAYTTDGIVYRFGQPSHAGSCSIISVGYAPLTEESDAFGNVVDYSYTAGFDGECIISSISWGKNDAAGIHDHFATATFGYDANTAACFHGYTGPMTGVPGAMTSYHTGVKIVTGASRLDTITITAYAPGSSNSPDYTRVVTLGYDSAAESCTGAHAPYRALTSITESASGTSVSSVSLPPVTFTYGNANFGTDSLAYSGSAPTQLPWASVVQPPGNASVNYNLGWGYRFTNDLWPTVEAMSIDVDGDGLVDRLVDASADSDGLVRTCRAHWYRNRGPAYSSFEDKGSILLPTLRWAQGAYGNGSNAAQNSPNERCALNYQYTAYSNSNYAGGDLGCPGATTCPDPNRPTNCYCSDPSLPDYGNDTLGKGAPKSATYLAYRWIDFDGDGKVDLVASPTQGGLTLDLTPFTKPAFASVLGFGVGFRTRSA